jgi:Contractile injection system tube protein
MSLVKAKLFSLGKDNKQTDEGFEVQFNPETLKVSYSNQVATGDQGGGTKKGKNTGQPKQFVGKGSTKLAVQLVFDTSGSSLNPSQLASGGEAGKLSDKDVRKVTKKVIDLITPSEGKAGDEKGKFIPPKVRLLWGSFKFDGIMESLEESLEFFAPEGIPLRASLSLSLIQQEIQFLVGDAAGQPDQPNKPGTSASTPGTQPLTSAPANSNLPSMASQMGLGANWQSIAAANGIENPRQLVPGQLINMDAKSKLEF